MESSRRHLKRFRASSQTQTPPGLSSSRCQVHLLSEQHHVLQPRRPHPRGRAHPRLRAAFVQPRWEWNTAAVPLREWTARLHRIRSPLGSLSHVQCHCPSHATASALIPQMRLAPQRPRRRCARNYLRESRHPVVRANAPSPSTTGRFSPVGPWPRYRCLSQTTLTLLWCCRRHCRPRRLCRGRRSQRRAPRRQRLLLAPHMAPPLPSSSARPCPGCLCRRLQ